ncbi:MAG TPA: hypothetical protein VHK90_05255 [Thermoanaerobaculia bacterium]|nr:hypothetical protein [Thermoanaerobaculia bacterium]
MSARRAIDENGALRADVLGRHTARLRRNAEANGDTCKRFTGSIPDHFEPTSSLDDLSTHAATIISGHVTAAEEGFLHGKPGTLLRIVGTHLKGKAAREVFLFYPHARIATADGTICAKPVVSSYTPPAPGDRLVVFSMPEVRAAGEQIILDVDIRRELLHESRGGGLQVPAALRGESAETFDEIERRITRRVRETVAAH